MDRVIYIDSLFIINFCIDFLALQASAALCEANCKTYRLMIGAFVGALYSVATAYFNIKGAALLLAGVAMAVFMCFVAFDFGGLKGLAVVSGAFFAVNISLGGAVSAIENALYSDEKPGAVSLVMCTATAAAAIVKWVKASHEKAVKKQVNCEITLCGEQKSLTLFCDSGNVLRDPFNGKHVIIVCARCFEKMARAINEGKLEKLYEAAPRIIPVNAAGSKSLLYGFKPESVRISSGFREKNSNAGIDLDVTVALDLVNDNFDGADGIISPLLIH